MARLRNIKSGAVVSVADEKVERLGSEWEPADKPATKAPAPVKKTAAKKAATRKSQ